MEFKKNGLAHLLVFALLAAMVAGATARAAGKPQVDSILIKKSARKLFLIHDGHILDDFTISLGGAPLGPKLREGDERTPEGNYVIDWKNPYSRYFLSLHVSYPNTDDLARARARGVMDPGGEIMIHGLPNGTTAPTHSFLVRDWTDGCIAVSNRAIQMIYALVQPGTPVTIEP